jgi:hypothetical protein
VADVAYQTEEEKQHYVDDELPKQTEHPKALAARRLLSDEVVRELLGTMLDSFGTSAIMGQTVTDRERAREQFLVVTGVKSMLEAIARGEIPQSMQ